MITLTRLSGTAFLLNADLIERVDSTPDTVITLVDGTKYVVAEPLEVVLAEVLDYRARIVARAAFFESAGVPPPPPHGSALGAGRLSAVPNHRDDRRDRGEDR
ncbi:MAG TPA: flagellar FlbD family protein [Nocardioides sp.]|nr:flagellar FlbD family protein [Nocardioides sp.]